MATVLTSGGVVLTPSMALEVTERNESQTKVHPIIGRPDPDVTLRPASTRTGTLKLGYFDASAEADSAAARVALTGAAVWTIVSDDRPTLQFSFIVDGSVSRTLDEETRDAWVVEVDYREVTV